MKFTEKKPTKAGRYTWRLEESSKHGYYKLQALIEKLEGELRVFSDGNEVTTLREARGGTWRKGHTIDE